MKREHYRIFRQAFPGIEIRSVTSGFPSAELGVGIAHPAFHHEINKLYEVVEPSPSPVTQLMWALGLVPVLVSDDWSFVLDVLFCGITLAGLKYAHARNMPFWKIDKLVRRLVGPNPFRAHDAIGSKGADFLTWSCLHHLAQENGALFTPTPELVERKESGQAWYPPDHFRPVVDWTLSDAEHEAFRVAILGPLFQMASLLLGFLLSAIYAREAWLMVPAIFLGVNGGLFLFNMFYGQWYLWKVLWIVQPLSLGLALLLVGVVKHSHVTLGFGIAFSVTSIFFSALMTPLFHDTAQLTGSLGAVTLMAIGGALLLWNVRRAPKTTAVTIQQ